MPVNVNTYDGTENPDDRLKIFQAAEKIERWAWCHMFNSTLIGSARVWFDKLPPESIDNYEMLRKAFLWNYLQQKKYIKDPVEIHHIKQREGESTESFMERFKAKNEMMSITTAFLRGEVAAVNQSKKKAPPAWKHHENDTKRDPGNRYGKIQGTATHAGPAENQNKNKFCEFHGDKGHSTDECIHLRRQIEEAVRSGQLSHLVKEIKQGGKLGEQAKATKKGEAPNKEKEISFSTLGDNNGQETPIVIEAEVEGHLIHRMYVDEGSASEIPITIQRYHRPPGSQKNLSGPIYRSQNDKIPSGRRNSDDPQQHHNTSEMQNGSRNPKYPSTQRTNGHGRNQRQAPDRNKAIQEEVAKLVEAEIMREVHYHDWLLNPVMVKKHDGSWRMCVDFTDLNKSCPKDCYPLPEIDWKVESLCGRGSIPRPRRQHARNQSLPRKDESSNEATITPNIERSSKPKREAVDNRSGKGIPEHEKMHSGTANGNRAKTQRGADNVSMCSQGGSKRNPNSRKGLAAEAFDITYRPRTSIRGQILADFIAEKLDEEGPSMEVQAEETVPEPWVLSTDGSSCLAGSQGKIHPITLWGSGAELILKIPEGEEFTYELRFEFDTSNNEAKYEALVAGLRIAEQMGGKNLTAKVDSRLVANQINGLYEAKEQSMTRNTQKKINRREGNPSSSGRRGVLLDDTADRIPYGRFGLPGEIISDNGKQFRDNPFKDWCKKLSIKQRFASVKHPQTNGQVERANRSLGEGIQASNGDTPFSLTYGTEAVIPVEIGMPSIRRAKVNQAKNDEALLLNLDILEERREKVAVREARNKAKMAKYYNSKVRSTSFHPGVFVYHSNEASRAKESGKLASKWEGPYEVIEALGKGAYKLKSGSGDVLPRT
ncbi:reverse transcriptase domain-containing protein [Tanacetum coccineum]